MNIEFGMPEYIKGLTNNSDTEAEYSYKAGDFVMPWTARVDNPAEGEPSEISIHIIVSPTLAAAPGSDGSYEEAPNGSIVIGNSNIYFKGGSLGAINGTWTAAALS